MNKNSSGEILEDDSSIKPSNKEEIKSYRYFYRDSQKTVFNIFISYIFILLITAILFLSMRAVDKYNSIYITNKNCNAFEIILDANSDGRFTYKDIGLISLDIFQFPFKFFISFDSFRPIFSFFEITSSDCMSFTALVFNEFFLFILAILFILIIYSFWHFCNYLHSKFYFGIFKMTPKKNKVHNFHENESNSFRLDLHINLILYFVVGLGSIFFLKSHQELFTTNIKKSTNITVIPEIVVNKNSK